MCKSRRVYIMLLHPIGHLLQLYRALGFHCRAMLGTRSTSNTCVMLPIHRPTIRPLVYICKLVPSFRARSNQIENENGS